MKAGTLDIRHARLLRRNIPSPATLPARLNPGTHPAGALGVGLKRGGWKRGRPFFSRRTAGLPNQTPVKFPKLHAAATRTGYFSLLSI